MHRRHAPGRPALGRGVDPRTPSGPTGADSAQRLPGDQVPPTPGLLQEGHPNRALSLRTPEGRHRPTWSPEAPANPAQCPRLPPGAISFRSLGRRPRGLPIGGPGSHDCAGCKGGWEAGAWCPPGGLWESRGRKRPRGEGALQDSQGREVSPPASPRAEPGRDPQAVPHPPPRLPSGASCPPTHEALPQLGLWNVLCHLCSQAWAQTPPPQRGAR